LVLYLMLLSALQFMTPLVLDLTLLSALQFITLFPGVFPRYEIIIFVIRVSD